MNIQDIKEQLLKSGLVVLNKYLDLYLELIYINKSNIKKPDYQKHHIIPKSYYKIQNLKVDNSSKNCVYLSKLNHIKAHYYLCLCSKGTFKAANAYATICLTNTSTFNEAVNLLNDLPKLNKLIKERNSNLSNLLKGKKYSQEHNKHLSESLQRNGSHKGNKNSMWGKHRTSPTYQRSWYNNGKIQKMISPSEVETYVSNGFIKGMLHGRWTIKD